MSAGTPVVTRTGLAGKVALVTGGAIGIGRAVAIGLAEAGADVAITYNTHDGDELVKEVGQLGRRAAAFRADMRLPADADAAVEAVRRELGPIGVLVANAGGLIGRVPLSSMSNEHWHDVLDTNLSSAFYVIRAALAHMNDDARIVLISSMAAHTGGSAGAGAYAAAKAGMIGLTRPWPRSWHRAGSPSTRLRPGLSSGHRSTSSSPRPQLRRRPSPVYRLGGRAARRTWPLWSPTSPPMPLIFSRARSST